ncbi:Fc.00g104060.m01.CDS01 [Cosmosporella sp. VM-42]
MSSSFGPTPRPRTSGEEIGRETKKRKIRKGTTSCWECKKRKTRCEYPETAGPCVGCQQRGTDCVSQEFDHTLTPSITPSAAEVSVDPDATVTGRLTRLESLLQKVVEKVIKEDPSTERSNPRVTGLSEDGTLVEDDTISPGVEALAHNPQRQTSLFYSAVISEPPRSSPDREQATSTRHSSSTPATLPKYYKIRRVLYDRLPSQRDADAIVAAGTNVAFLQFFTVSYSDIFAGKMRSATSLSSLPGPQSHPILLARALVHLAVGIQLLPTHFDFKQFRLGDDPKKVMKQYLELASNLVTNNDELIGNMEGLECIVLEGVYQINEANVRRAWLLFRRAINLGQLMGLHRGDGRAVTTLDPHSITNPVFMWSRIVHIDRFLALLLGLPAGHPQKTPYSSCKEIEEGDCTLSRMELIQSEASAQIIERNENMACEDYTITQGIDVFLNQATQRVPADWWSIPNLRGSAGTGRELQEIMRIMMQITHYNLVVLLHLPYMLRVSRERRYDYSKIACLNASRDLLMRFISFRSFTFSSFSCRGVDLTAFTGSLTLLLAHLDNRRNNYGMDHLLTAKRRSDLALVEQTIALVLGPDSIHNPLSEQIATILRRVLAIEGNVSDINSSLRLMIPYFGEITIMREGIVKSPLPPSPMPGKGPAFASAETLQHLSVNTTPSISCGPVPDTDCTLNGEASSADCDNVPWDHLNHPQWHYPRGIPDSTNVTEGSMQENTFPAGLTADVDSWALQGVDSTFFDNLLRGNDGSKRNGELTFNFPS